MQHVLSYLGGLFDGEGCITITRHTPTQKGPRNKSLSYGLCVQIKMNDPRPVKLFATYFSEISVIRFAANYGYDKRGYKYRPSFRAKCTGKKAEEVLKHLLPYLLSKREEAEYAMEFRKYMRDSNCRRVGFARRPIPSDILAKRHVFYLNLQKMKRRHYTMPLAEETVPTPPRAGDASPSGYTSS